MTSIKLNNMSCASDQSIMVSIVCITYNQEDYIAEALDSFIIQKTTFPIEIIVHDDASTDSTADIIREYAEKYPDIFVCIFQKENQYSKNPYSVLEVPISTARGKYIALCEGDDYWTDSFKLQKQVSLLEAKETSSFSFHNAMIKFDDKSEKDILFCTGFIDNQMFETKDFILKNWFCPTASIVFKKACLPIYPDWAKKVQSADLTLQLLLSTNGNAVYLNEDMSVYRKNALNSLSLVKRKATYYVDSHITLFRNFNKYTNYKYIHFIINKIFRLYMSRAKIIIIGKIRKYI